MRINTQLHYSRKKIFFLSAFAAILAFALYPESCLAIQIPTIQVGLADSNDPKEVSVLIEILLLFTVLSMAPAILLMMTCFTRLVVAFSFLKKALGTQTTPPNQILIGLSLFLTLFIMSPVFTKINDVAVKPYLAEQISAEQALEDGTKPLRAFMFKQTREKDLALFMSLAKLNKPQSKEEVPTTILIPAFMISELKTAFQIGLVLLLSPFPNN